MKKVIYIFISLVLFSCHSTSSVAQSKKAREVYFKADNALAFGRYDEAIEGFEEAIAIDDKYLDAHIQLANLYQNYEKDYGQAVSHYEQVISIDNTLVVAYYNAAICLLYDEDFEKAEEYAQLYLDKAKLSDEGIREANLLIENIHFAQYAIQNPVPFDPQNLGDAINSTKDEYFPSITANNEALYFTVKEGDNRYPDENIYVAHQESSEWNIREKLSSSINSPNSNEGAHAITTDGKYLFYASDTRSPINYGRFDIFMAKKIGDEWQQPFNMGEGINTRGWDSQPMLSADGRSLYFVAQREGGQGGSDIYMSYLGNDGTFGKPQNLGAIINTHGDEQRPQLHPDGNTLYFVSDGHVGMGGLDIFMSQKDENGDWTTPINLGYPINTSGQELGIYVSADGLTAFMASEREGGYGGMDIYRFDLPEANKPQAVINIEGHTFDRETNIAVSGLIKIYNLETGELYKVLSSDAVNGHFLLTLPTGRDYSYTVTATDYLPFSANFSLKNITSYDTYTLEAGLSKMQSGQEFTLYNIFFDVNSAELKEESKVELKQLIYFLTKNPTIKIEIGGHTDDIGSDIENQLLSENRAKAVLDYLVENEISSDRLSYVGYGEEMPVVENSSDENRAKNRRTTFKVM